MAVTISAAGTSQESFKIGLTGPTIYQGSADPIVANTVLENDVWLNANTGSILFYKSGVWTLPQASSSATAEPQEKTLTQPGEVAVLTGTARWYPINSITLGKVRATISTPPTGSDIVINVNVNGASIGTTTIVDGLNVGTETNLNTVVTPNDYVTVDINQVGSTTAGTDLVITFGYEVN